MNPISLRQRAACVYAFVFTATIFGVHATSGQTPQDANESQGTRLVPPQRTSETEAVVTETNKKLQQITVPQVTFNHLPISEAVDFLRHESVRLDKDSPPDTRGVWISVQWWSPQGTQSDGKPSANPPPVPEPTITLHASNVSLGKALRYLAGKLCADMEVTEEGVIVLRPFSILDPFVLRGFRVAPEKLGFPARVIAEARNFLPVTEECKGMPILDAKPFFRSKGFEFPADSYADYLPHIGLLIVRLDLEETMDKFAACMDQLSTPLAPPPTPANP